MRLLFLTNFYPPARPGGYTQWCYEVATGLKARGHKVAVITSRHDLDKIHGPEPDVYRVLHLDGDLTFYRPGHFFLHWRRQQLENQANFQRALEMINPDLVFVWGMWSLSHALPALAEARMPDRVAYYLSDYWPASVDMHTSYWRSPAQHWHMQVPKRMLGSLAQAMLADRARPRLELRNAFCVSAAVRDILVEAGIRLEHARIIHGGTDVSRFGELRPRTFANRPLRLLYAGQLVQHKGVHTAIEALGKLGELLADGRLRLSVVGSGRPDYVAGLRELVKNERLEAFVEFCGPVGRSDMPAILAQSDVLIFPSIYEEPFARMTQEAMLAGLVVVGTTTGGTKEILEPGINGLTFAAGDADGLARQVARLASDPELCQRLATAGRQTVLERFTLQRMIDEVEEALLCILNASSEPVAHESTNGHQS
jgi:glycogen synthase